MDVFFGQYDYYLFSVFLILNILIRKFRVKINFGWVFYVIYIILFGFILPFISGMVESEVVHEKYDMVDGFNLLYIFFRWPTYWVIGFIEFSILKVIGILNQE